MIFEFNSNKLFYDFTDRGHSVAVVLLHGWGGNHKSLYPILPAFDNYNILSIDFWGFGLSDKPKANFDIYSYSNVIYALIKHLSIPKIILVGHSFGGRISIILGAEYPELVEKIVLIDSAGIKPKMTAKKFAKKMHYKLIKYLVKKSIKSTNALSKFASTDYKNLTRDEQIVFNKIINKDLSNYLEFIKAPTLLIWGELDKDTPLYMAKKINKKIPNSKLYIIKNASHFAYLQEKNITIKLIKDFIK